MRNVDISTRDELIRIARIREPGSVTIYVPTSAELNESDRARIEVKGRLRGALAQLEAASTDAAIIDSIANAVDELLTNMDPIWCAEEPVHRVSRRGQVSGQSYSRYYSTTAKSGSSR